MIDSIDSESQDCVIGVEILSCRPAWYLQLYLALIWNWVDISEQKRQGLTLLAQGVAAVLHLGALEDRR